MVISTKILAVAYYRMSSDEQEGSIEAQQLLVERYAADHG
jgi:DNA invertase Pin-like site-specific DNA recombinase